MIEFKPYCANTFKIKMSVLKIYNLDPSHILESNKEVNRSPENKLKK